MRYSFALLPFFLVLCHVSALSIVDNKFVFEQWAFWATTGGIVVGAVAGFFLVYSYLKVRKIL